ncbi:ORF2 [torque teno Delphinidae virus 30]
MGLTGKERHWVQLCTDLHSLFCNCGDPTSHLTRCLMDITEEERATAAAFRDMDLATVGDGEPADRDTGPGTAAEPSTAG